MDSLNVDPTRRVRALLARKAELDLKIARASSKVRQVNRRRDTRAKILLGSALIGMFQAEPIALRSLMPRLLQYLSARDRTSIQSLLEEVVSRNS